MHIVDEFIAARGLVSWGMESVPLIDHSANVAKADDFPARNFSIREHQPSLASSI